MMLRVHERRALVPLRPGFSLVEAKPTPRRAGVTAAAEPLMAGAA
jgi:hypothetical protein